MNALEITSELPSSMSHDCKAAFGKLEEGRDAEEPANQGAQISRIEKGHHTADEMNPASPDMCHSTRTARVLVDWLMQGFY